MKSLLKRLCWIVAIGIISYSYHLDCCYSAVLGPQTQRQEYHMDLPDENVNEYYNIYKTRLYKQTKRLEVELSDVVCQKSDKKNCKVKYSQQ